MRLARPRDHVLLAGRAPPVAHGDTETHGEVAAPALEDVVCPPVRRDQVVVHRHVGTDVVLLAGREDADDIAHQRQDVRLVDRAADRDEVADVRDRPLAVPGEAVDDLGRLPTAEGREPARIREMVERHHRLHALRVTLAQHPPVVVERGDRELAVLGLDPRPLDREPVGAEAVLAHERDVLGVTVIAVGAVARGLEARRVGLVLERPPVVVPVAALDLMRGCRHTPNEALRESHAHGAGA